MRGWTTVLVTVAYLAGTFGLFVVMLALARHYE